MRNRRMVRGISAVAIAAWLLLASGCSTVQDLLPDKSLWSLKDFEQGFEAIGEEASTDQVVQASAIVSGLTVTMLTEDGKAEFLKWDYENREVVRSGLDNEAGFAPPDATTASAVPLSDIDLQSIVEQSDCDRDVLTFNYRAVGMNGEHSYLKTECFNLSEATTAEFHDYLDGEPLEDPDLTDPAAVEALTKTAMEYTGQPQQLTSVGIGTNVHKGLDFQFAADTKTAKNLEARPCRMIYFRATDAGAGHPGAVRTACHNPDDSSLGKLKPYDPSLFDPSVLAHLWKTEVGDGAPANASSVTLLTDLEGDLIYEVVANGQRKTFDPVGKPVS